MSFIVGLAGGSGSGKTTFANRLHEYFGEVCQILGQDNYYIDQSKKFDHDGGSVNFDHPSSLEFTLLAKHLAELRKGHGIELPLYDFATHTRMVKSEAFTPKKIIIVDGTLILSQEIIREQLDLTVFTDCPEEIRFQRRLKRDVEERGRTPEGVKAQFYGQVAPMHNEFVAPSMKHANHVANVENFDDIFTSVVAGLRDKLSIH